MIQNIGISIKLKFFEFRMCPLSGYVPSGLRILEFLKTAKIPKVFWGDLRGEWAL